MFQEVGDGRGGDGMMVKVRLSQAKLEFFNNPLSFLQN
jgi:hypothetical protein